MPSDIDSFGQCLRTLPLFPTFMPLLGVTLICVSATIMILRHRTNFGQRYINIALIGMLIWIIAIVMKAMVDTPACQVFWSRTSYLGVGLLPPAWFLFAYRYATGESGTMKLWQRAILWGSVALTVGVIWTNPWHVLFYGPGSGHVNPITRETIITKGPLYWPMLWFYYSFILAAIAIIGYCIYRSYGAFRLHFIVLAMLTLLPTGVSLAYTHLGVTISGMNPTPFAIVAVLVLYMVLISDNEIAQTASLAKDQIFLDIPNPMLSITSKGRLAMANRRAAELFDIPAPYRDIAAADLPRLAGLAELLESRTQDDYTGELTIDQRLFEVHASHVIRPLGRGDPVMGWLVMLFDVTERRKSQDNLTSELSEALRQNRRIMDEALTDPLTGLLNRRALAPEFAAMAEQAGAAGVPLSLTLLDLDHFKAVNDSYGHATGDLALTILAEGLTRTFRSEDRKFRIGGEEFVILSAHLDLPTLMRRLDDLRAYVFAEGKRRGPEGLALRFSAGIALLGEGDQVAAGSTAAAVEPPDLDQLLARADARLYGAKMAGRNRTMGPQDE